MILIYSELVKKTGDLSFSKITTNVSADAG